jgi:hypothetical protein
MIEKRLWSTTDQSKRVISLEADLNLTWNHLESTTHGTRQKLGAFGDEWGVLRGRSANTVVQLEAFHV